jgi:AcrR family transcriptional regulator
MTDVSALCVAVSPVRDPERTRARILAAATSEFLPCGLGGARVDRIAAEADTNKRMLYYYFGSKEGLFLAVLEAAYEHIRCAETKLKLDTVEPLEGIRRLVAFTWRYYLDNPHFLTLLNSENLHRARHLKTSKRIAAMHSPFVASIADLLGRAKKAASSGRASIRFSSIFRSQRCRTSTCRTTIRSRRSSSATCSLPKRRRRA